MFNLENIIWIIPGFFIVFLYDRRRPIDKTTFTGWYLFFTVILFSVPLNYLIKETMSLFNISHSNLFFYFIFSILLTEFLFFLLMPIFKDSFGKDIFLDKCKTCMGKIIFLTLKNDKAYIGFLMDAQQKFIAIAPLISGGRTQDKKIKWTDFYYKVNIQEKTEILIPCKEIITFGRYNQQILSALHNKNKNSL